MENLRTQIEQFIYDRRPDCIIADKFYPWTSDVAAKLGIQRLVFNATCELEAEYAKHYQKMMGHKVWHVGPVSLIHRDSADKAERGHKTAVDEHECLSWLDSKEPDSVLYVCFGSLCHFPDEQLFEIASALEASGVSAGLPMITWPLYAEHFNNEKLVTQVLKIGVEVGVKDWKLWVDAGKKVTKREDTEKAVAELMNGGDEAVERRKLARKLGETAKNSVKEGGSSHRNLTALIDELKRLKASRVET
ncbi:hypothetical protein HHK36_028884 [Tetracentron sinense]|uniref:Uncharacterized protein n=1 Tax=Tetracentron sinense TaxID=13715 RepID=A0A834YBY8_TETSI|nr:hypothetical protein HHK36_028884 [Tetracentron sinense]